MSSEEINKVWSVSHLESCWKRPSIAACSNCWKTLWFIKSMFAMHGRFGMLKLCLTFTMFKQLPNDESFVSVSVA